MLDDKRLIAVVLVAAVVGSAVGAGVMAVVAPGAPAATDATTDGTDTTNDDTTNDGTDDDTTNDGTGGDVFGNDSTPPGVAQFESEAAAREFVRESAGGGYLGVAFTGGNVAVRRGEPAVETAQAGDAGGGGGDAPQRVSGTNVQEVGIDEPDILKTDGTSIFYSEQRPRHYYHEDKREYGSTTVLDASDPANPEIAAEIGVNGKLLLSGDDLVVFAGDAVYGYDVSDPGDPKRTWEKSLEGNVVTSRLMNGTVYLVVATGLQPDDPCPVRPMGGDGPAVECTDVYHPTRPTNADATYTTMTLNPASGEVTDSVSVVGTRAHSATYVSDSAVYLTYSHRIGHGNLFLNFLIENQSDVLDDHTVQRLREVRGYNLSSRARQIEVQRIFRGFLQRLDEERRENVSEEIRTDFRAFIEAHKREIQTTGVVKVGTTGNLSVDAVGEVPGRPLNQFSMDEHDGKLRIATTVQVDWRSNSTNDVYVLNDNLSIQGSVQGMADGQRIYSVRFMQDTAYVVTFRRVDPFHVIDLSEPSDPEELGQVKLPGFSRYLHPIGENRVLGIGQEDGKVKATVFNVSDPANPVVEDSRIVDAGWSAIERSHHAFLQDPKHEVFFLPTTSGGYVFSYSDGLEVTRRVDTEGRATRAMYLDNYMYVFSTEGLTVLDESDWTRTATLDLYDDREDPREDDR